MVRFVRVLSVKTGQLLGFFGIATLVGLLCAALAIPVVGALAYGTNAGAQKISTLPAGLKIPSLDGRTYVYDNSGDLVATFFSQDRVYVPIQKIAPVMQTAIVDIEDERFYTHGAADIKGTLRAIVNNAQSASTQGGSTLTQQYVKQILINEATTPAQLAAILGNRTHDYGEKLRELQYAIALEGKLTKKQILEGYLNISPFGQSVYGIEAGAEYYFGTTAARLTLPQAAMLAGEVQAPSVNDPTAGGTHVRAAINRRNVVLAKMYSLKHISRAAYETAIRAPLGLHVTKPQVGCAAANVSQWYCDYILRTLENDPQLSFLGASVAARDARLYSGGLKIYTALNPGIQQLADAGMAAATNPTDKPIVSTAIVQPGTGNIVAISNSKNYSNVATQSATSVDYAVPTLYGSSSGIQPGSGMKPITMAVALEQGLPLNYPIVASSGVTLASRGLSYTNCAGENVSDPSYQLTNEGGENYGSITMLRALWESVNSYFVQLEAKVGLCPVAQLAAKIGMTSATLSNGTWVPAPLDQVPTLTIGTDVTSPLQMSELYATLANHGVYCAPRVVTRIVDVDADRVLYDQAPQCTRVMPADVADAIDWALYHNVQGDLDPASTARFTRIPGIPTGGKTGTTDSHQAVWFNGYNPQFAASVAISVPYGQSVSDQEIGGTFTGAATGGQTAGRIWTAIMKPILEAQKVHPGFIKKPADRFGAPGRYTGEKTLVPDVTGLYVDAATSEIVHAQLTATVATTEVASTEPKGTVDHTAPGGGTSVLVGSSVQLFISNGIAPSPTSSPSPSSTSSQSPSPNPTRSSSPTPGPTQTTTARPTSTRSSTPKPTRTRKRRSATSELTASGSISSTAADVPASGSSATDRGRHRGPTRDPATEVFRRDLATFWRES